MPVSIDAERSILGAILLDSYSAVEAAAALRPEHFHLDSHRKIFTGMIELYAQSKPVELIGLSECLTKQRSLEAVGGVAYLSGLTDGIPRRASIEQHIRLVKEKAALRQLIHSANALIVRAYEQDPPGQIVKEARAHLKVIEGDAAETKRIGCFDDIPDLHEVVTGDTAFVVPELIPDGALVLLAGEPGIGKSFIALKLSVSCALGSSFLGRDCSRLLALYLDRENPGTIMRDRLQILGGGPVPNLKLWGAWLEDPAPDLDDPRLLEIAATVKPLIVIDSLLRFHNGEENSASDMAIVMAKLRALANAGATVLVIHHKGKSENAASYRGSSDIGGGCDVVYSLTRDENGLLTLRHVKNRFGSELKLTIRPDYAAGTFELTDSPALVERRDRTDELQTLITDEPGLTQNKILARVGGWRGKTIELLKAGNGRHWRTEIGTRGAVCYYPLNDTTNAVARVQ